MDATPRIRVEAACQRLGREAVVERCLALLAGGDESPEFIIVLGGRHAQRLVADGVPPGQQYWLRVHAARGLLWAGPGDEPERLRAALQDETWRVREMICKVAARHRVDELLEDVITLENDAVPRVRAAATRAVLRIVGAQGLSR